MTLLTLFNPNGWLHAPPCIDLKAVINTSEQTTDGVIVECIGVSWKRIIDIINKDKAEVYKIDPFKWEEILAGAYKEEGYDVIITPRSGDHGRDIIAEKKGYISIRIFDQMKAYAPGRVVTANDVRAMLGTINGFPNVSKGIITTTSKFAPRIMDDPSIALNVPNRIQMRDIDGLTEWLKSLTK